MDLYSGPTTSGTRALVQVGAFILHTQSLSYVPHIQLPPGVRSVGVLSNNATTSLTSLMSRFLIRRSRVEGTKHAWYRI